MALNKGAFDIFPFTSDNRRNYESERKRYRRALKEHETFNRQGERTHIGLCLLKKMMFLLMDRK